MPDLAAIQAAFESVVHGVSDSVVGIRAQRRHLSGSGISEIDTVLEQVVQINGSGTVIRPDGLILTNEHVVHSASDIEILFNNGTSLPATVVAADPRSDLAVLHVARRGLTPARIADHEAVGRGQWAIAVGNPFGLGSDGQLSVSVGVISNLNRRLPGLGEVDDRLYNDMIQTTASINPGNSGGPLFNVRGEMIGVVTAMHTRAAVDEGIGFAVPMTPARLRIIDQLCAGRAVAYGYLGLKVRPLEDEEYAACGLDAPSGALVEDLEPGGPADRAGMKIGDVVVRYGGHAVRGPSQLVELVGRSPVGEEVRVDVVRAMHPHSLRLEVDRREVSRVSWMRGSAIVWRGLRLSRLTPEARRHMSVEDEARGLVVIDVLAGGAGAGAGVQVGDVLHRVGGEEVETTAEFLRCVQSADGSVALEFHRGGVIEIPGD